MFVPDLPGSFVVNVASPSQQPQALRQLQGLAEGSADTLVPLTPACIFFPVLRFCWIQSLVISSHSHSFLAVLIHPHVFNYCNLLIPKALSSIPSPSLDLWSTTPDGHLHQATAAPLGHYTPISPLLFLNI